MAKKASKKSKKKSKKVSEKKSKKVSEKKELKTKEIEDEEVLSIVLPEVNEKDVADLNLEDNIPDLGSEDELSDFDVWFESEGKKMIKHGHSIRSIVMRCVRDSKKGASFADAYLHITPKVFNEFAKAGSRNNISPIEQLCQMAWDCSPPEE